MQTDIDKILEVIQRKVLKGTHLPVEVKEIQAGYLHRPHFKDLYLYLLQNGLPSSKLAIKKLEHCQRNMSYYIHCCSECHQKKRHLF